ncbi:18787_t:CDS:2, partial [Gigaspora rosea]
DEEIIDFKSEVQIDSETWEISNLRTFTTNPNRSTLSQNRY